MAGQVRFHEKSSIDVPLETIRDIDDSWKRNEKYRELYEKTNVISYRKLRMAANTLYYIGEYIIGQQYLNALEKDMADKNIQMLKESSQRMELERNIKSMEFQALAYQINPHFMFNTLNAIGRLAMMEKAYETEEIIYSFSDIMRYILNKSGTQTVTLKEEVAHTKNYLSVQKTRLGDRLLFAINFKPEWDEVSCPFMFLQPIIENSIKYAVETREKGGKITVEANRDGNDLVITVADDGDGMSRETIEAALSPFDAKGLDEACIGLRNINSRLIYLNGEKYSLKIESPNIKNGGTKVMIRLPI
jgi:sensor histidine kinase YesM